MAEANSERGKDHPVWEVYDYQRTLCLNVKYYGHKLHRVEQQSLWTEVFLAITAPGSAVAAFWLKEVAWGNGVWKAITAVAALVAIVKPFLRHAQRIKKYERALVEHRNAASDVEEVIHQIKIDRSYSKVSGKLFDKIVKKKRNLVQITPDPIRDRKLVEKYMSEVNEELPTTGFYIPEK